MIDETTAMSVAQKDEAAAIEAFWWTGIAQFTFWNLGTVIGVLIGEAVGDPNVWGLDAAFPASFVGLLGPHLATAPGRVAGLIGASIDLVDSTSVVLRAYCIADLACRPTALGVGPHTMLAIVSRRVDGYWSGRSRVVAGG